MPEMLDAMLEVPGRLRFVIQPLIAIALGFRDGRKDAGARRPPFGIAILFDRHHRAANLGAGIKAIAMPLTIGIVADLVVQYLLVQHIALWHGVIAGAVLIALPYILSRGLTNRALRGSHPTFRHHHSG